MAVPFSNTKLRVPIGFHNVLEGLTREILRSQPHKIYEFGTSYFEILLRNRLETGFDPALHGARLVDRDYNNKSFKNYNADILGHKRLEESVFVDTGYMELESKAHDEELKQFEAAMKIQAAFRGYLDRQDVNKLIKSKHSIEREKTDEDMVKKLNDPNVRNAAYKIQAGFKSLKEMRGNKQKKVDDGGEDSQWQEDASSPRPPSPFPPPAIYLPKNQRRKSFQKTDVSLKIAEQFDPKHEEVEQVKIDVVLDDPEVENAASTIQAALKGSMFRKKILGVKGEEPGAMPIGSENNSEVNKMEKGSIDIDLNDPEVENAAKKIQAGFKMSKSKKNTANEENVKEK